MADVELQRAAELAAEIGLTEVEVGALELLAGAAATRGDLRKAAQLQQAAVEASRQAGHVPSLAKALYRLAEILGKAGRREEGMSALAAADGLRSDSPEALTGPRSRAEVALFDPTETTPQDAGGG